MAKGKPASKETEAIREIVKKLGKDAFEGKTVVEIITGLGKELKAKKIDPKEHEGKIKTAIQQQKEALGLVQKRERKVKGKAAAQANGEELGFEELLEALNEVGLDGLKKALDALDEAEKTLAKFGGKEGALKAKEMADKVVKASQKKLEATGDNPTGDATA